MQDNVVHHAPESADEPTEGAALDPQSGSRGEQNAVTEGLQDTERNPSDNAPKPALQPTEGESYRILLTWWSEEVGEQIVEPRAACEGLQDTERNPSDNAPKPVVGIRTTAQEQDPQQALWSEAVGEPIVESRAAFAARLASLCFRAAEDIFASTGNEKPAPPIEESRENQTTFEQLESAMHNEVVQTFKFHLFMKCTPWTKVWDSFVKWVKEQVSEKATAAAQQGSCVLTAMLRPHGGAGQVSNAAVADLHLLGKLGNRAERKEREGARAAYATVTKNASGLVRGLHSHGNNVLCFLHRVQTLDRSGTNLGKGRAEGPGNQLADQRTIEPALCGQSIRRGQMSSGAMAPDMPASMETAEDRRWVVQGTIQSVPPVREASPRRSASPAVRPSEARPFYDLMREMRDMWSTPLQPPVQCTRCRSTATRSYQAVTSRESNFSISQGARQLLPELRARRRDLDSAIQAIEARSGELRQRCAEAEREALEDFEVLRNHLNSVESLKQAVLSRERDVRLRLAGQIEEFCQRLLQADGSNDAGTAALRAEFPDLHAAADVLCSRACSLPQVEVPIDDVPFEARARSDKLRRYVVAERLLKARDACLWRREQQRRQLAAETAEGAEWIRHLGSMLDRYAEELGYVCYFCSERFAAAAANTRCAWNQPTSPSGRALSPDRRVPQHLSGSGAHFWVPLPSPSSAAAAAAVAGTAPDFREHHAFHQHWASAQVPPPPPPPPWVEFPEAWAPPPPQVSSGSRAASPSATRYGGQSFAGPTAPRRELAAFGQAGPGGAGDVSVPVSRGPAAFVERRCGGGGPLPAAEARSGDLLAVLRGREEAEGFALV
ncbi:unnamed protein product [Symbiodinium sp. CCMP2456]|nr:unnamed protein product [Symbiodinium sp. CCMP2456]